LEDKSFVPEHKKNLHKLSTYKSENPDRIYSSCAVDREDPLLCDMKDSVVLIGNEGDLSKTKENRIDEKTIENLATIQNTVVINDETTTIVKIEDADSTELEIKKDGENEITKIDNSIEQRETTIEEVKRSNEKVAKWIDNNNDTLEKIRMETCGDFEKEYYGLLSRQGLNPYHMNPSRPPLVRHPPASPAPHNHPVRFIQIRPMPGANTNNPSQPNMLYPPGAVRFVRMPAPPLQTEASNMGVMGPGSMNRQEMPYIVRFGSVKEAEAAATAMTSPPPYRPIIRPEKSKKDTELSRNQVKPVRNNSYSKKERRKRKSDSSAVDSGAAKVVPEQRVDYGVSSVVPQYPKNAEDIYKKHLHSVEVELHNKELWEGFNKAGTEMILTRNGRYV